MSLVPPVTQALILLNTAFFALDILLSHWLTRWLGLWPIGSGFLPWQVASYAFLHRDWMHLFFNMLGLFMFGSELERLWGPRRYLLLYGVSVLSAAAAQLLVGLLIPAGPTIGASGGVFGVTIGYLVYFGNRMVMPVIPPVPIRARYLAIAYIVIELGTGVWGSPDGVAHSAHLGGALGGYLMIRYWRAHR